MARLMVKPESTFHFDAWKCVSHTCKFFSYFFLLLFLGSKWVIEVVDTTHGILNNKCNINSTSNISYKWTSEKRNKILNWKWSKHKAHEAKCVLEQKILDLQMISLCGWIEMKIQFKFHLEERENEVNYFAVRVYDFDAWLHQHHLQTGWWLQLKWTKKERMRRDGDCKLH